MKISESVLRAAAELEIRSRRRISSLLAGNYRTAFRGAGMQFREFRKYEPGDDIRHMSWPVTARTGHATVKIYEEERELDVVCLIDASGSSLFGNERKRRVDMYAELLALIGLAAVRSGDNLGLLLFDEKPQVYLPPKRTRDNVLVAISHLLAQPLRAKRSDLATALRYLGSVLKNRALIVVLSDFMVPPFGNDLKRLARRHELILMHCYDEAERGERLHGVYEVCDPETGEFSILDTGSKSLREALLNHQLKLTDDLRTLARDSRSDYLSLSMEDEYLQKLVRFFKLRGPARV